MATYLIWLIVGLLLCIGEIFVGAFVLLVFGAGAIITGAIIGLFGVDTLAWQLLIYALSTLTVGAIVFLIMRNNKASSIGQAEQFVGEIGMVVSTQDVDLTPSSTGQVRFQKPILGSDLWSCRPREGTVLKVGNRVRLIMFQGSYVLVENV